MHPLYSMSIDSTLRNGLFRSRFSRLPRFLVDVDSMRTSGAGVSAAVGGGAFRCGPDTTSTWSHSWSVSMSMPTAQSTMVRV